MHDEVIANIRERIAQIRKVMALAHDPRMIEVLQAVIASGEADIERLEAERDQPAKQEMPPPNQH